MVYFITSSLVEDFPVKIGFSDNPESRLKALQTGCPYKLHIAGEFVGSQEYEGWIHRLFGWAKIRDNGEWYDHSVAMTIMHYLIQWQMLPRNLILAKGTFTKTMMRTPYYRHAIHDLTTDQCIGEMGVA